MARIPFAEPSRLSPRTLKTLEALPDIGIFRLLAQADGSFTAFSAFTGSLWNDAELSPRRRELVILLVARLASGAELNEADFRTFYGGGAEGYTDYPALDAA